MAKITSVDQLVKGKWVYFCCEIELQQLETDEDIDYYSDFAEDDYEIPAHVFDTKREALLEICSAYERGNDDHCNDAVIADIDQMLREIE